MRKVSGSLLFAILLFVFARAQNDTSTFTYTFKLDQDERYKINLEINGNLPLPGSSGEGGQLKLNGEMFLKVKKIRDDRRAEIVTGLSDAAIEFNGQPFPLSLDTIKNYISDMEAVATPRGELSELKGGGRLPFQLPGIDPRNLFPATIPTVFPENPVKPGDTWNFTHKFGPEDNADRLSCKAKLEGMEEVNGHKLMKISQEFNQSTEVYQDAALQPTVDKEKATSLRRGELKGTWLVWIDSEEGLLYKAQVKARLKQVTEPVKKDGSGVKDSEREIQEMTATLSVERVTR